eukprot:GFUD01131198.1.p1 GENE.GFUD01131198.1~~GFUD01131198.1.p1  ORF type:complete len:189 (+),score=21.37 GFUD01131198.1:100-666(+)
MIRMWKSLLYIWIILETFTQLDTESFGEKILRKIVKTCGQPKINNVMRNLTLNPGDTARFRCTVDMKCMVSYIQWYHEMNNGSMRLLRTGATQGTPYRYTIRKVTPHDSGFYSCVAGNILGETVSSAFLEINGTPSHNQNIYLLMAAIVVNWSTFYNPFQLRYLQLFIHIMVSNLLGIVTLRTTAVDK